MLLSKINQIKDKEKRDDIVAGLIVGLTGGLLWGLTGGLLWGLTGGLAWGLVVGLAGGLLWGLTGGLVVGLAGGLAWGLVVGLVVGLAGGLVVMLVNFKEAFPFLVGVNEIFWLIIGIILLIEFIFWLDKSIPKKNESGIKFTIKRKLDALLTSGLILSFIGQAYVFQREIRIGQYMPEILRWIGYIGVGIIVLAILAGLLYLWIYLNSRRYD